MIRCSGSKISAFFEEFKEKQTDGTLNLKVILKLKLEHVSFTYPFSKVEVLHDLNLEFNAGEKIPLSSVKMVPENQP